MTKNLSHTYRSSFGAMLGSATGLDPNPIDPCLLSSTDQRSISTCQCHQNCGGCHMIRFIWPCSCFAVALTSPSVSIGGETWIQYRVMIQEQTDSHRLAAAFFLPIVAIYINMHSKTRSIPTIEQITLRYTFRCTSVRMYQLGVKAVSLKSYQCATSGSHPNSTPDHLHMRCRFWNQITQLATENHQVTAPKWNLRCSWSSNDTQIIQSLLN